MFSAIRAFQEKNGLATDEVMTPNGPTQLKLNQALVREKQRATLNRNMRETRSDFAPLLGGTGLHRAERSGGGRVGHADKERTGNRATAVHAGPRTDGTAGGVPVINLEKDRIANILANEPARFEIVENPDADASDERYVRGEVGKTAVANYADLIVQEARRQGVDPDLIKAIVFAENARGHYFGLAKFAEGFGIADSIFPMNINPSVW